MIKSLKPRRFGIELELSRRLLCVNETDRHYGPGWTKVESVLYNLREDGLISRNWRLKTDTSCGGEIVSPILYGFEGLTEAARICNRVNKVADNLKKDAIDGECGLHLHFDAADMQPRQLSNLFILIHMAEPIIFSMYPYRNMSYCAPVDVNMRLASRFRDWVDVRDTWYRGENNVKDKTHSYGKNFINGNQPGEYYDGTRYHGFNIHCYWRQGTVEFRYGKGTLDPLHIRAYYEMCLSMVNTAMDSKKIKMPAFSKDMRYKDLINYYGNNFRFRKLIQNLCKDCNFSRNTIRLIMSLIRKNKPHLLSKMPNKKIKVSTISNTRRWIFKAPDGTHFNWRGDRLEHNQLLAKLLTHNLLEVDYDYERMSLSGWPRLKSTNPNYKIGSNIFARYNNNPIETFDTVQIGEQQDQIMNEINLIQNEINELQ